MKRFLPVALLGLAMSMTGCAGGWRGDVAPGAAVAAPVAKATPAPGAGADGVTFVWKGEGGSVSLAGEFNGWNTSADPLKKQADGSWTITKKLEPGRYMYKFVVDGTNWKEDPTAKETADDGYGGKNAVVIVGGGAAATPGAAAAKPAAASGGTAAGAEGVTFVWKGEGGSVSLAGEFNGWNTSADPLKKQADGSWTPVEEARRPAATCTSSSSTAPTGRKIPRRRRRPTTATAARTPSSSSARRAAPLPPPSPLPPSLPPLPAAQRRRCRRRVTFVWKGERRRGQPGRRVQRLEHRPPIR